MRRVCAGAAADGRCGGGRVTGHPGEVSHPCESSSAPCVSPLPRADGRVLDYGAAREAPMVLSVWARDHGQ